MEKGKAAIILGFYKPSNEDLLVGAVEAVKLQTYKNFDIWIYDNSLQKDSLSKLRKLHPDVRIISNSSNVGFAGGNNSVMRRVINDPEYNCTVLLNDDTKPDREWLENLVKTADENPKAGAVTSKLVFFKPYIRLNFKTNTFIPVEVDSSSSDTRELGIKFFDRSDFVNQDYNKKFYRDGFYGFEDDNGEKYTWTKSDFSIDLPIQKDSNTINLIIGTSNFNLIQNGSLEVKVENSDFSEVIELKEGKNEYRLEIPKEVIEKNQFDLIQNAGSGITAQFQGYDIGSTMKPGDLSAQPEKDGEKFNKQYEPEMFCGAAVLLKNEVLRNVGLFDEFFVVYYEDSDLSLRVKKAGWKIIYEPKAKVRHIHTGSSGEWSPLFRYHYTKNRIAFVTKNFGPRAIVFVWLDILKDLLHIVKIYIKSRGKNKYMLELIKPSIKGILKVSLFYPSLILKRVGVIKCN